MNNTPYLDAWIEKNANVLKKMPSLADEAGGVARRALHRASIPDLPPPSSARSWQPTLSEIAAGRPRREAARRAQLPFIQQYLGGTTANAPHLAIGGGLGVTGLVGAQALDEGVPFLGDD